MIVFYALLLVLAALIAAAALQAARAIPEAAPPQWHFVPTATRPSAVTNAYDAGWTADEVHTLADQAARDGRLELADTLRATAHALHVKEALHGIQRRESAVRATARVLVPAPMPGVLA